MDRSAREEPAAPFRASPFSVAAAIKAQSSGPDQTHSDIGKMLSDVLGQLQEIKAVQVDMRRVTGPEQANFVHDLDMLVCERLRSQTSALCDLLRPLIADEVQGAEKRLMEAFQNPAGVRNIRIAPAAAIRRRVPTESFVPSEIPNELAKSATKGRATKNFEKVEMPPTLATYCTPRTSKGILHIDFMEFFSTKDQQNIAEIRAHWHVWWLVKIVFNYWFKVLLAVCTFSNLIFIGSMSTSDVDAALDYHNVRVDWGIRGLPSVTILPHDRITGRDNSHDAFREIHKGEVLFACLLMFIYFLTFMASPYWFLCGKRRLYYIFGASVCIIFHLDVLVCAILGHVGYHFLPNLTFLLVFHWIHDLSDGGSTSHVIGFLRIIVAGAIHSLAVVFVVLALTTLLCFCFGVITLHGITTYLEGAATGSISTESLESIAETYGSLGLTLLSFTMAISGGVDWREILKPLRPLPWVYTCWTMLFVGFSVFGILNVVTAVFVDFAMTVTSGNKQEQIRKKLSDQQEWEKEIIKMFEVADEDGSGTLSWEEFEAYINHPVITTYFNSLELDFSEAQGLFKLLDIKNTGAVSIKDFVAGCSQLKGVAKSLDLATVRYELLRFVRRYKYDMEKLTKTVIDQRLALEEILGDDFDVENLDRVGLKRGHEQQTDL